MTTARLSIALSLLAIGLSVANIVRLKIARRPDAPERTWETAACEGEWKPPDPVVPGADERTVLEPLSEKDDIVISGSSGFLVGFTHCNAGVCCRHDRDSGVPVDLYAHQTVLKQETRADLVPTNAECSHDGKLWWRVQAMRVEGKVARFELPADGRTVTCRAVR